jgi:zinc transport system substrate-binding protein
MRDLRQRGLTRSSPVSRLRLSVFLAMPLAVLGGCREDRAPAAGASVAASIFPLYDVVRRVAGGDTPVALVLPGGHTEHAFEPRPRELARLSGVALAFGIGLGLDPWLARVAAAATDGRARVVELGPSLDPRPVPAHVLALVEPAEREPRAAGGESGEGPIDPHVHLDPVRMSKAARLVAETLAGHDPAGAFGYRERGARVAGELDALDLELRARSAAWKKRVIVTFHGSFFYFADRYGLTIAAVVEPLPGREPTARYIARVVEAGRARGAVAVFTEPQLDPGPARVIAEESGLPLYELDPVGGGPGADSYEALLRKNAAVLDEALR